MSGINDDRGQLALMDAMVFFVAALFVSGLLSGRLVDRTSPDEDQGEVAYVQSALASFLGSSIGQRVLLDIGGQVEVRPWEIVGDCLMVEIHALRNGVPADHFTVMNKVLDEILEAIVERQFRYSLVVLETSGESILELPSSESPSCGRAYAASATIADTDGTRIVIVLQLRPASLPESPLV